MYSYWLQRSPGLTPAQRCRLVTVFGNAYNVYNATDREIGYVLRGRMKTSDPEFTIQRESEEAMQIACQSLETAGINFMAYEHPSYPSRLRSIPSAPYGIYTIGLLPKETPTVAIVGSRKLSEYGRSIAAELGESLGRLGICVISGMARGVDSETQKSTLAAGGHTVAVLGCGVDVCYPGELKNLYREITQKGCILSELPPGTQPVPQYFPSRNRLISGLADAVIVVEAAEKSGSLITADMALEQGRDVYACPGRIGDSQSEGCNRLIAQGAGIITSVEGFLRERGYLHTPEAVKRKKKPVSDPVLELLDAYPRSISQLKTNMPPEEILRRLTILEIQGLVRQHSPGYYIRVLA